MDKQNKKEAIKTIKRLWNKAEYILNNKGWSNYGTQLLKQNRQEAQSHDTWRSGQKRGLTITEESKFFSIKRLSVYLYDLEQQPDLKEFMHMQKSIYMAFALAKEFKKELKKEICLQDAEYLNGLDYVELIKED